MDIGKFDRRDDALWNKAREKLEYDYIVGALELLFW